MEKHDLKVEPSIYKHDKEYQKLVGEIIQKCFPSNNYYIEDKGENKLCLKLKT